MQELNVLRIRLDYDPTNPEFPKALEEAIKPLDGWRLLSLNLRPVDQDHYKIPVTFAVAVYERENATLKEEAACFPPVEDKDIAYLLASIDYLLEAVDVLPMPTNPTVGELNAMSRFKWIEKNMLATVDAWKKKRRHP